MHTYEKGLCSICCLGYRHAQFVEQHIKALWDGEYRKVEIIAVDDGSPDNSVELLTRMAEESPFPMTVMPQTNTGNVGKNFNRAKEKARGEYITFISLDDILFPDAISRKIAIMEKNAKVAFVASSTCIEIDGDGAVCSGLLETKVHKTPNPSIADLLRLEYESLGGFYIQGNVFRRDIIDAVGGFDEDMTGDDIVLRTKIFLYIKAHPEHQFAIISEPACYYRKHPGNIHKIVARQFKIITEYLQKYWPDAPNPDVLIQHALSLIRRAPFEEYIDVFALNARAASVLLDPRVQGAIVKSLRFRCLELIYVKRKLSDGTRKVRLFSCLEFSYRKARPKSRSASQPRR